MSFRADIADALGTVQAEWQGEQVTLHPTDYRPDRPAAFAAWPEWQGDEEHSDFVTSTWFVFVVLPADDARSQTAALHALRWPVRVALTKAGHVGRADLATITAGEATMPALRYQMGTSVRPGDPIPDER